MQGSLLQCIAGVLSSVVEAVMSCPRDLGSILLRAYIVGLRV